MPQSIVHDRPLQAADMVTRRRRSLVTNLVVLGAGAGALLCFIAVLADMRRSGNAMRQASIQVEHYTSRMQGTGVLPLNLEPHVAEGGDPRLVAFEALPVDQAMALRSRTEPVLVAWSPPVFRLFGSERRSVVIFHRGRFFREWMSENEFTDRHAAQLQDGGVQ